MARKPFTHASERADDLLGLIHSDVCEPFRTTSREGANYYVTFANELSRYGYVYLMKHKHEVFEMFKTFQNEVENQLGKTIKALRADRGDLDEAAYIFGIQIYKDRSMQLIGLSPNAYIDKILKRFKMDTSKRETIPMQPNVDLSKAQGPSTLAAMMRMKGIPYALVIGVVDWKSSKQSTTAMSSMEVEYITTSEAAMEAIWICKFIYGLGVVPNNDRHIDMYCDNTGAITIVDELGVQKGAKHFRQKYHFV
nr:retrotransposon protein, putative, Ty1-copia subclass [Tanacetum cinerariifolium]